jgi:hypothetical protein
MSSQLTTILLTLRLDMPILYAHQPFNINIVLIKLQIVPGNDNAVAIELISTHIHRQLKDRSMQFRKQMASTPIDDRLSFLAETANPSLILLPQTRQLKVESSSF